MPEFDQLRNNSVLPPPQLYILIISSAWFFSVEGIQLVISTRGGGWLQVKLVGRRVNEASDY